MPSDTSQKLRATILREVGDFLRTKGSGSSDYAAPDTLKSFRPGDMRFLAALNELIAEGLLLSVADESSGRIGVRLNPEKREAIDQEVRLPSPWWKDPKFVIPTAIGLVGTSIGVAKFLLGQ